MNERTLLARVLKEKRLCCYLHPKVRCTACNVMLCDDCDKETGPEVGFCNGIIKHHWSYSMEL